MSPCGVPGYYGIFRVFHGPFDQTGIVTDQLQISEREPSPGIHKAGLAEGNILRCQGIFMTGHDWSWMGREMVAGDGRRRFQTNGLGVQASGVGQSR